MYTSSVSTNTIFYQRCLATRHAIADNKQNTFQLNLTHVSQPTFFQHQHLFRLYFIYTNLSTRNLSKNNYINNIKQQADLWNLLPAHPFLSTLFSTPTVLIMKIIQENLSTTIIYKCFSWKFKQQEN